MLTSLSCRDIVVIMVSKGTGFDFYYVNEFSDGKPITELGHKYMFRATDCCKAVVAGTKYAVSAGWVYFSVYDRFDKIIFSGKITF